MNKAFYIGIAVLTVGVLGFAILYNSNKGLGSGSPSSLESHSGANVSDTSSARRNQAPDFSLQSLDGNTITLSEYRGKKPVILDFFATWCPNCKRAMPKLNKWYEKYKDQVEVIGVDLQEDRNKVQKFIDSRNISFPIVLDPNSQVSRAYGIRYTNTHFLIDIDGNIVREIPGDIRESDVKSLIL